MNSAIVEHLSKKQKVPGSIPIESMLFTLHHSERFKIRIFPFDPLSLATWYIIQLL